MSKLNCWYDDRNQPYFRLMPIRVEQQSFDPVIYTFHNILSDKEIDALKVLAEPLVIHIPINSIETTDFTYAILIL